MALTKVTGHVIKSDTNITSHNINSSGIVTAVTFDGNFTGVAVTFTGDSTIGSLGITTNLNVGGISTLTGNIDANGSLDVDGHTELDNLRVSGVSTLTGRIFAGGTVIPGYSGADDLTIGTESGNHGITIRSSTTGGGGLFFSDATSAGDNATQWAGGLEYSHSNGELRFYQGGTVRGMFQGGGHFTPWLDSTGALGTTSKRWSNVHADAATIAGNATISGNLTVDGVLTYQDVTNIDSIGIVTARAGIVAQDDVTFQTANGSNIFIDKSDNSIRLGDSVTQYLGSDNDLWFLHNGSTGYIHNVTGSLYIRNESAGDIYIQGKSGENSIICNDDGNVQLYNDNVIKFNTTSTGVTVHGSTDPNLTIRQGASSSSGSGFLAYENVDGNGQPRSIAKIEGKTTGNGGYGELNFQTQFNNTLSTRWTIDHTGQLVPGAAGAVNIGSASLEIGHVYIADDKKIYLGSDQDTRIYHSGSHGYIKHTGTGNFYIDINNDDLFAITMAESEHLANFHGNGAVELFHNASKKFETTSLGVTVTGEVAATQDYPTTRPRLDFNFEATKKLDQRITYYRTGPASFTDEFGKLIKVGDNEPRFDHNFSTGESLGLLMEATSTNISRYSEQASGPTNWNQFGSISENVIEAPDGTMTADKLEAPTSGLGLINIALSWTANVPHTFSIFAKSGEFNRIGIRLYDGTSYFMRTTVNLDTGEAVNNEAGTLRVDKFANGWWRISTTGTPVATYNYNSLGSVEPHNTALVQAADPSSSKEGIYIWGWQMEAKGHPTSYIPTNGAAVTRGNEHAVIDGEDFTDFYNPSESSVLAVGTMQRTVATQGQLNIFHIGDSNEDGHGVFREHGTKDVWYHIRNNNSTPSGGNLNPNAFGDWNKDEEARIAVAFKDGDQAISVNGGNQVTASVTSSYPTADITKMWIGSHGNGSYFEGHIKRIAYYPKLLTDNQLNTLTA